MFETIEPGRTDCRSSSAGASCGGSGGASPSSRIAPISWPAKSSSEKKWTCGG